MDGPYNGESPQGNRTLTGAGYPACVTANRKSWKRVRHELAVQQDFRCCYCKQLFTAKHTPRMATIEHVKPRADGGTNRRENLKAACRLCNQHRGRQMNTARQRRKRQNFTAVPLAETISIDPVSPITS
jgi:5-methylcytosine-specific restriction endonuclease McrA